MAKDESGSRQEFVILGYVASTAAKGAIGALLLGYYDGIPTLHYAGRVGTGYSSDQARSLRVTLDKLTSPKPKLSNTMPAGSEKGVRWARPQLVCEVVYRGLTADRLVRQAAFKGLREDRPAIEIVLEMPPDTSRPDRTKQFRERLTHPERILWPNAGVTKEGLAEILLRHCRLDFAAHFRARFESRPLSGWREQKCFFAKRAWQGLSGALQRVDVGEKDKMLALHDLDGLIDLIQASILEIHPVGLLGQKP